MRDRTEEVTMVGKNAAVIGTFGSILFAALTASAQQQAAVSPRVGPPPSESPGGTDHDGVVGHFGATYFGIPSVPIAAVGGGIGAAAAPVLGVRYWLMPNLGIDAGVGIGWFTGDAPSPFAMVFHGGVPLALAEGKHYAFLVIPEINLGFAHENVPGGMGMANTNLDGLLFNLGGRVGAEIQFGFIGIPQLSLQGSIGLLFQYSQTKTTVGNAPSVAINSTSLATTLGPDPWAIFTNSIAATYYF
jgi:hypothetical protein